MRTVKALRYSVDPVVRCVVHKMTPGTPSDQWALLDSISPLFLMTVRSEFDDYCLKRTIETGVEFRIVKLIHAVEQDDSAIHLDTDIGMFHSRFLIGADGANSQIRRLCAFTHPRSRGFAIEGCVNKYYDKERIRFDFGAVANGYGWVFPKGDHVNIGLCKYSMDTPFGRHELSRYAADIVGTNSISQIIGQYVDCNAGDSAPVCGRSMLVGDAGSFADGLTGEGIYHAIASGQAAAKAIMRNIQESVSVGEAYTNELRLLCADLSLCRDLAQVFYSHLDFGRAILNSPHFRQALTRTYASGDSFSSTLISLLRPLLRLWQA